MECGECEDIRLFLITPRVTPCGELTSEHIQPVESQKYEQRKCKQILIGQIEREIYSRAEEATLATIQLKKR
jgi:hypothetical protein